MHAKTFVTSTQEQTHTPYLLGCATNDGKDWWEYIDSSVSKSMLDGMDYILTYYQIKFLTTKCLNTFVTHCSSMPVSDSYFSALNVVL